MLTGFRVEGINVDKNSGELFFGNLSLSYVDIKQQIVFGP